MAFIPNLDNLPQVNHIDGDKLNNILSNLEWVTIGGNQKHAYETGLKIKPKGLLNGRQELEEEEVLVIYHKLLNKQESIKSLSDTYNVTTTQIGRIKKKEAWSHLTENLPDIEIRLKTQPLDEYQKDTVATLISRGYTYKESISIADFNITSDQFYRIKYILQKQKGSETRVKTRTLQAIGSGNGKHT
jgi:hypothetical protein